MPQAPVRKIKGRPKGVTQFFSNATGFLCWLSNFYAPKKKIVVRWPKTKEYDFLPPHIERDVDLFYATSEHAYHALNADPVTARKLHCLYGLASFEDLHLDKDITPQEFYEKCVKMERTFGKKHQDGIIAKVASTYFKKRPTKGFSFIHQENKWDISTQQKIWFKILLCKFDIERNPDLVKVLLETGDTKLVEFHRSSNKDSFWSAKVTPDGEIIGRNFMGEMLERVREHLKSK